jgi:hypothetical protein
MERPGDSVVCVTRPALVLLMVVVLILFALPLGLGMGMDHGCPDCHLPGTGLLDGCVIGLATASVLVRVAFGWRRLRLGSAQPPLATALLTPDRPPRPLASG